MLMTSKIRPFLAFATLTLFALAAAPALAQNPTVINGQYNNLTNFNGFDITDGNAVVVSPAEFNYDGTGLDVTASTVTVTDGMFNNNQTDGLYAGNSELTINGGTFDNNGSNGLYTSGSDVTITNGTFDSNIIAGFAAGSGSNVTVSGGTFSNNVQIGLLADPGSNVTVTGGTFTGNRYDGLYANVTTITVYGSDFTYNGISNYFGPVTGIGSFTGLLQNNTDPETIAYQTNNGSIILKSDTLSAVPEPSSLTLFAVAGASLLGLMLRAKCRMISRTA